MTAALELSAVTAGYDGIPVVHHLDLTVEAGEVVALLGANGAGKTTTLLTVSGLLRRLAGDVRIFGDATPVHRIRPRDVWSLARAGVAHVPEDRGLFFDLTARENLRLGSGARRAERLDPVLDWFPALGPVLDRKAGLLSGGEQQMLALGRAVIGQPRLLMVDEMSLGLAPLIVERLLPVLRTIATDTDAAVLVVEQHIPMALSVADRAYVLSRGRLVASGPAADLAQRPEIIEAGYLGD